MDTTKPAAARSARHVTKRQAVVVVLSALLVFLVLGAYFRGTWAETRPDVPRSSSEGIFTQLYQTADGRKQVRVATVVDYPLEKVWAVLTDYEHYPEIFPQVKTCQSTRDPKGRHQVQGVIATLVGEWPFEVPIVHEEYLDDCQAYWNEPRGDLTVNRGSWWAKRWGEGQTLLILNLDLEVASYPTFLVRNYLLSRLPAVVAAVNNRLKAQAAS